MKNDKNEDAEPETAFEPVELADGEAAVPTIPDDDFMLEEEFLPEAGGVVWADVYLPQADGTVLKVSLTARAENPTVALDRFVDALENGRQKYGLRTTPRAQTPPHQVNPINAGGPVAAAPKPMVPTAKAMTA